MSCEGCRCGGIAYNCELCEKRVDMCNRANVYNEELDYALHSDCVESYNDREAERDYERRYLR